MILEPGAKVLVAHRRLFESDHNRYFTGVVEGYEDGIARVTGRTWVRDGYHGEYKAKSDTRTKIFSLSSGTVIFYQLPAQVDVDELVIETQNVDVVLRDEDGFRMDLTEGVLHHAGGTSFGR